MKDRFTLTIKLGNDAMRTSRHVAAALNEIAKRLRQAGSVDGLVRDVNGNTVGQYEFVLKGEI
jgi:hypothetical protein